MEYTKERKKQEAMTDIRFTKMTHSTLESFYSSLR